MNFERRKRGFRSDKRGVSEIVGNILILMITVILFSTIVAYVNQIPVPETTTKADFAATVSFETNGTTTATLTVTHAGGVVLDAAETAVFIEAGTSTIYQKLSLDADFPFTQWSTGSDWTRSFDVPSESTEITVTVIDLDKSAAVWTSQVSGGSGGSPPIILQRYADSNPDSQTADPVKRDDTFSFFVKVIDLDNDLNTTDLDGVRLNSNGLPGGSTFDTYEEFTSDGWFRFDFGEITVAEDGHIIKIYAWDNAGHGTVSSYVLSVTVLPSDTVYQDSLYDVEGGIPRWITYKSDGQGWGMYHQNTTTGLADVNRPNNTFSKDVDEVIFIRAASTRVHDLMGTNELVIRDTRTNTIFVPTFNGSSTAAAPFYVYTALAGATIYECQFKTESLPPGSYDVSFILQGSGATAATFKDNGPLYLEQADSPISFMPRIWVYDEVDGSYVDWGSKTTPFDVSTSTLSRVLVRVEVQDAEDAPSPVVEDVRITDMRGDTQLHGTPPSGSMLTAWVADATTDPDNHTYWFEIDLRVNNEDQWISGTNAYTLKVSRFSDANEGVYSLSCKLYVRASTAKADFFVGAAGFMTGTSNFVNPAYLYYIQNNNFFTKRTMYDYSNAPSSADNYATSALGLGDLDGDGDLDALMGQYRSHNLYYIENSLNSFGSWQEASEITRPSGDDLDVDINWITCGDINGDGDVDFAYSTTTKDADEGRTVVIYNNTFGATGYVWDPSATDNGYNNTDNGVRKILLEDVTGDGRCDLLVLAEGRIWIYDLVEWDSTSTIAMIPGWDTANTNVLDFDVADVDGDGFLDIVTVDSTSGSTYKGVRVWYYVENASPDEILLDDDSGVTVTYGGYTGEVSDTETENLVALVLAETAAEPNPGKLDVEMATADVLTDDVYQQLEVRAKVSASGGTAAEGFYIWYSIDGVSFTPLIYVPASQTEYESFVRPLPSTVVGHTLYLRITDTLTHEDSADEVIESLHLDYVAVITGTFGTYSPETVITTTTPAWQCVAVGNINGLPGGDDLGLEIVVAKDGQWMTYNRTGATPFEAWTALPGWAVTDATMFARGDTMIDLHSSMASDENAIKLLLTYSSPRLFKVVDINGDGYDDIITVNSTIAPAITSQVALHLNMYGCEDCSWLYYVVKDIAADYNTVDVRGGMTWLEVANLRP